MLITSWNAPKEAFTLPGEFFNQHSVDEGSLFGFHRMNTFIGIKPLQSINFMVLKKNADVENDLKVYQNQLTQPYLN